MVCRRTVKGMNHHYLTIRNGKVARRKRLWYRISLEHPLLRLRRTTLHGGRCTAIIRQYIDIDSNSMNCAIRASYKTWHQSLLSQVLPIQGIRQHHQSRLGKRLATNKVRAGRSTEQGGSSDRFTYSPISVTLHARENLSFLIRPRGPTVPIFWLRLVEDGYLPDSSLVPDFFRERERYDQRGRDREP
jgi:hypothetical protein